MDPYEELANAIILQAVKDYRGVLSVLKKRPDSIPALSMKDEIERFLRSGWYQLLTTVDGEMLISRLQAEAEEDEGR